MKKLILKIIDLICFVGGSVLLIFNLLYLLFPANYRRVYHIEYSDDLFGYRIGLIIGLGLIVLGFLIRTWRKDNRNLNEK